MKIVNKLDYDVWKDFVNNHPLGNIYHTPEMFEVYSIGRGYRPTLWAVIESDRILALHIPVQITIIGGPFRFLTTRDVDFGGVLVEKSETGREGLALMLREYNSFKAGSPLFTEFRNVSDQGYIHDILQDCGYVYEDHLNYLLDLNRGSEDILQSFTRSTRSAIRKTLRTGEIRIQEIVERTNLPIYYEMLTKTYKRVSVPLPDISLFEAAFDILQPKNMARFTIAYVDGTPAAAQVSIIYKDVILGWYNGVDISVHKNCNEFVMWDNIEWGARNGYGVLDFGGAGKPEEESGVRNFKAKFKGELVNYGRNTRIHAPLRMKISESTYQAFRDSLSFLRRLGVDSSVSSAQ